MFYVKMFIMYDYLKAQKYVNNHPFRSKQIVPLWLYVHCSKVYNFIVDELKHLLFDFQQNTTKKI